MSTAAFLGILWLCWVTLAPRSRWVAGAVVLMLVTGLPLHYSTHSYAEMPGAFFVVWLVHAWLRANTGSVFAAALFASLIKETSLPFLGLTALLAASLRPSWREERARLAAVSGALVLGSGLSVVLNLFRFGVPYNARYLLEASWAPDWTTQLQTWAALWVSPNGGLLFFFPAFVLALAMLPWVERGQWRLAAGVLLLLGLLTLFLARWWSPFGWWAWGQRLSLPFLPAALLLLGSAYAPGYERLLRRLLGTPLRARLVLGLLLFLGLAHVASISRGSLIIHDTFTYLGGCEPPLTAEAHQPYYRCIAREAWSDPSPLGRAYRELFHERSAFLALTYLGALASLGFRLR
jgi:hypothetical protein